MNFAEAATKESMHTTTTNGMFALNTTGNALLDLYASIGALRSADEQRIKTLFAEAWKEDPLFATKIVFYARDIRGGNMLGERQVFRTLLRYMAVMHPEAVRPNLDLIGVYGRYDDLYCLMDTPLEADMWKTMKAQFEADRKAMAEGENVSVSLLAKWIKTADSKQKATRELGITTALKLGYTVYAFKRIVRDLRKRIGVIEQLISNNRWDEVQYPTVPSRAMKLYRKAFERHDGTRFGEFTQKALRGEEKIHSAVLYPYDIIAGMTECTWSGVKIKQDDVLEAQWRQLPDYVPAGTNAMVIADTSGSMFGRPIQTALGLAVYFAERNTGAYNGLFMSFSGNSTVHRLKGETLAQKLQSINMSDWGSNTNIEAALEHILEIANQNHVPADGMPKSLIIISDMQFDEATSFMQWTFYDHMEKRFAENGYQIPNIVFWNANSPRDTFHADANRKGVQLVSGQSAGAFRNVIAQAGMNPVEAMCDVINSERYAAITIGA